MTKMKVIDYYGDLVVEDISALTTSQQTHNKLNFTPLKPFVYKSFVKGNC